MHKEITGNQTDNDYAVYWSVFVNYMLTSEAKKSKHQDRSSE